MTTATEDYTDFVHIGPGTLAGRYMRMFWQPVARGEDLPAGRAKPMRIMGEDFTLYRGESGTPHAVEFRCAHRSTQLSTGWIEGDDLRCIYHGWKYDSTGRCLEQPGEPEPFADRIRIRSYPTEEYLGLIFVYFGEGEPPPLPRYPTMERPGVLIAHYRPRAANYFQMLENDPGHGFFLHDGRRREKSYPRVDIEETEWGLAKIFRRGGASDQVHHSGWPNVTHNLRPPMDEESGWIEFFQWMVPVDDEHTVMFQVQLWAVTGEVAERVQQRYRAWRAAGGRWGAPDVARAILHGDMTLDELRTRTDVEVTQVEDDVAQIGQGVIVDRTREHLGHGDLFVELLRSIWQRELQALAEGRPVKQWIHSEAIASTEGPRQGPVVPGRSIVSVPIGT